MFAWLVSREHVTTSVFFSVFTMLVEEPSLGILSLFLPCSFASRSAAWITILLHLAAQCKRCLCSDGEVTCSYFPEFIKMDQQLKDFVAVFGRRWLKSVGSKGLFCGFVAEKAMPFFLSFWEKELRVPLQMEFKYVSWLYVFHARWVHAMCNMYNTRSTRLNDMTWQQWFTQSLYLSYYTIIYGCPGWKRRHQRYV